MFDKLVTTTLARVHLTGKNTRSHCCIFSRIKAIKDHKVLY